MSLSRLIKQEEEGDLGQEEEVNPTNRITQTWQAIISVLMLSAKTHKVPKDITMLQCLNKVEFPQHMANSNSVRGDLTIQLQAE